MCRCVHLRRRRVREKDGEKGGREKEPAECGTNSCPIHPKHAGCVCFRMPKSRRPATSFFILFTGEHTASFFWLRAFLCDSNVPHEIKITLEWCSRLLVFRSAFLYGSLSNTYILFLSLSVFETHDLLLTRRVVESFKRL